MSNAIMKEIIDRLTKLVSTSREIQHQLETPHPSLDMIQDLLQQRSRLINELDSLTDNIDASLFSPEERETMTQGFRNFRKLHAMIQPELEKLMNSQEENLGEASKRRKAEDRYHFLETPDISYISDT